MLLILFTILIVGLITYLSLKPLINNLFYSVSHEPIYIHSYIPGIGFGLEMVKDPIGFIRSLYLKYGKIFVISLMSKRLVYFFDEQTYLTKVLKSPDLSIDEFLADAAVAALGVDRQCLINEDIQATQLKQYHQYLIGDELEILNKRSHDSIIRSMTVDLKISRDNNTNIGNIFDLFSEFILYAASDGLYGFTFTTEQRNTKPNFYKLFQDFDQAFALNMTRAPFRSILYRSTFENYRKFINRFSSFKLNNDESKLVHAREELWRSDAYKHLFREYDIAALQAILLWAAVSNTAPLSCWSVVDLLLHPEALEAVKQELKENIPSTSSICDKEILDKLKILDSCINETIRRASKSSSTRQAMVNTTIECVDKTKVGLRKGDMLIYPAFLKHFDSNLFGQNPYGYQYDRFVKKTNQPKAPSLMLFGCGTHVSWTILGDKRNQNLSSFDYSTYGY